jgi:hypothetical protein
MTTAMAAPVWEKLRTPESRNVEEILRRAGFQNVDAYRYNSASIRVRVIDERFEGLSSDKRDSLIEPHLNLLPERTQADIMTLLTFAPSELEKTPRSSRVLMNVEFDDPSPSLL